jgi:hypothetical protein
MAAGKYSFVIEQGTTVNFEVQYKDSNSDPIDLTGYSAKMQLRPSVSSETVYLTLSSSLNADGTGLNMNGSLGSKPTTSGSIGIFIASSTSSLLSFDTAYYDLEIYSGSTYPVTTRVLEGQVKLSKEVTR